MIMATDPVCGMYVDEGTHLTAVVRGRKYYFCSETCLEAFTAPEKEMARLTWLTLFSLGIGIPLFVVGLGQGLGWWLTGLEEPLNLVFFVLATPVQFVAGYRFYRGFVDAIRNKSANMDVLRRKEGRRHGDWRDDQPDRIVADPSDARRRGHDPEPNHQARRGRPGVAGPHPTSRGSRGVRVRPRRRRDRGPHILPVVRAA